MSRWFAAAVVLACGCEKIGPGVGSGAPAAAACGGDRAETKGALTWIEDDYPAARACAKQRGVPVVVDEWAPWCHTCKSMSQLVLTDPAFAPFADRFVFVGIDTEKDANAPVIAKLPIAAWPTYFVVSPDDETVEARFVGAATVAQWKAFLAQGETAYANARELAPGSPLALVRDGDRAAVAKDWAAADRAYEAALAAAPDGWDRRADVLVSQMGARAHRGDPAACLELASRGLDGTGRSSSVTDFVVNAEACLGHEQDAARPFRTRAAARIADVTGDPSAPLSIDDRSDGLETLRELEDELDQHDQALAAAERQRVLLDGAVAHARTPAEAATYNYQRADVYAYLGRPNEIVADLVQSANALPDDYDPPYRLANLLVKAGRLDEAATWMDRAIELAYGPRKGRMLGMAADIAHARGDRERERRLRAQVVSLYESLPAGQVSKQTIDQAKGALATLSVN